jgi:hypothetical protein
MLAVVLAHMRKYTHISVTSRNSSGGEKLRSMYAYERKSVHGSLDDGP